MISSTSRRRAPLARIALALALAVGHGASADEPPAPSEPTAETGTPAPSDPVAAPPAAEPVVPGPEPVAPQPTASVRAVVDRVAAVVEDEVITLSEVYDLGSAFIDERCPGGRDPRCVREAELEVLDSLILRALMFAELKKLRLDVTSEELDRTIDQVARDHGLEDTEALRREVEKQGMTWETYREQLMEQLRQMRFQESVIRPRVAVTRDELVDLYKRTAREYQDPNEAEIEAITLALPAELTEDSLAALVERARAIQAEVNGGTRPWEDVVATEHSGLFVPASGKMGTVEKGDLRKELDAVVFATEAGRIADPVVVPEAGVLFLVRVVALRQSQVLPFEEVEEALREEVYRRKVAEQVEEWYQQTRRQSSVRVLLEAT